MTTLYRKYRPQFFSEVAGQTHVKQVLQNEIKSGKIAHAFLFSGPRGIGKTTIARILAKAVNCENRKDGKSEPCNNCDACREIIELKSLDVIEMDAATHTQVDKVRENIVENVRFTPSQRKYKVFIIDEVHMLSTSAFNALLKTLEEPPAHAIFILATTEIHKIPETIISRCQRFDFHKINSTDLLSRIKIIASKEGIELDEEVLQAIAQNSDGGLRDAEGVLGQILSLSLSSDRKMITMDEASIVLPRSNINLVKELITHLTKKETSSALKFISKLTEEGVSVRRFIDETIEYLRGFLPAPNIANIIEILLQKKQTAQFSKIDELPLELAVVEICGEGDIEAKTENLEKIKVHTKTVHLEAKPPSEPLGEKLVSEKSSGPDLQKNEEIIKKDQVNSKSNNFSLDEIKKRWYDILKKSQEYNHSLPVLLNIGVPVEVDDSILKIGFQYPIYKERLNKEKNREIVEKLLCEVLNKKVCVEGIIVNREDLDRARNAMPAQIEAKQNIEDLAVQADNIAESFGGKVIE